MIVDLFWRFVLISLLAFGGGERRCRSSSAWR
jgi:hypothetical protein